MTFRKVAFFGLPLLLLGLLACLVFGWQADPTLTDGLTDGDPSRAAELGDRAGAVAVDAAGQKTDGSGTGAGRAALVDPEAEYDASLAGFKGRLVDEKRRPMSMRIVRFYRLDAEIIQNPGLFADSDGDDGGEAAPKVQVHQTESAADGRFEVTGAWPHAFYILEADPDGDNRLTMPVDRLPGPGEIVDLGDIVLEQLGVIVGRVVDRAGQGVAGVMVRAMDIPGTFLDLAPIERFDPEGALLIRAAEPPLVIEMPRYVKRYHDIIVRPRTVTMADGRFRLGSVQPGDNVMMFNKKAFVPRTRKGVKVKAAATKEVGDVKLSEGEEAFVKVRDTNDQPVAGAEVLIGAKIVMLPLDFASRVGETDAKGEIYALGIPAGQITVAARRTKNHPWVVVGPINVAADVVVRLPAWHHLDLTLSSTEGQKIVHPEFRLLPSPSEGTPLDLGAFGFIKWLDISKRVDVLEDGIYRIKDLSPGKYTLAVCSDGHAAGRLDFKITTNAKGKLVLRPESRFTVLVRNSEGAPVRRARIYVKSPRPEQGRRLMEVPIVAGETDEDGKLVVREGERGQVRLSASHPAYGFAHAVAELPTAEPIVLEMDSPGQLLGRLTEAGGPPTPGKWTVVLAPRRQDRVRGAWPDMPKMTVPDLEGEFHSRGLRPGKYRLIVMRSVKAMSSPGGLIGFMMKMRMQSDHVTADIEIEAGQQTYVELDAIKEPAAIDGPAAQVSGMILVNGRPGKGLLVSGRGQRRYGVTADAGGLFNFGLVPVGELRITVSDPAQADMIDMRMESHLWRDRVTIEEGVDVVLDISVETGRVSGFVRTSDGQPGVAMRVKAVGRAGGASSESKDSKKPQARTATAFVMTDQQGRFSFDRLPAGVYRLESGDRGRGAGTSQELELLAGGLVAGVAIELAKTVTARGKVDLAGLGGESRRGFLEFEQAGGTLSRTGRVRPDGTFRVRGLRPGVYKVKYFTFGGGGPPRELAVGETVTITDRELRDLVLTPIPSSKPKDSGQQPGRKTGSQRRKSR